MSKNYQRGVSIAELTVVILIIALLTAIVSAGVNVKNASELRGFISEIQSYQAAVESFDYKYDELPGDMVDAHDFWGSNCNATASKCNGDSDGEIDLSSTADDNEAFRAWQHLALSGFVDGSYTGEGAGSGAQADIGLNVARSKRSKVGYMILWGDFGPSSRNEIQIGAYRANAGATDSSVTPKEALSIDKKMDDGLPAIGFVFAKDGAEASSGDCVDDGADNTLKTRDDTYNTSTDELACRVSFPVLP
jgi:Tfp pilus assembly protein PilV